MKLILAAHKRCIALDICVMITSQTAAIQKPEGKYLLPARGAQPWIYVLLELLTLLPYKSLKVNICYPDEAHSPRYMKVNCAAHKMCIALDICVTRTAHTAAIQKPEGKYLLPTRDA